MYLNCKTWFSLRYGTIETERLVELADRSAVASLALTNINSTADAWDFVYYCNEKHIKPVVGAEIRNDISFMYVLLARNNQGFLEINRFLSTHLQKKMVFPDQPRFSQDVLVIYPLGKYQPEQLQSNELIGVQTTEVNKLYSEKPHLHPAKY